MLKRGVTAKNLQFYLKKDGSGGGTRTPDTRIMIKLLQLFLFYNNGLYAHRSGVLKSV
jgi:hypothetical protein